MMQIENLRQELDHKKHGYSYPAAKLGKLSSLPEIHGRGMHLIPKQSTVLSSLRHTSKEGRNKNLLDSMIARKLYMAGISISKGLYPDARKSIESVLRLDPQNKEAKKMLKKMPA